MFEDYDDDDPRGVSAHSRAMPGPDLDTLEFAIMRDRAINETDRRILLHKLRRAAESAGGDSLAELAKVLGAGVLSAIVARFMGAGAVASIMAGGAGAFAANRYFSKSGSVLPDKDSLLWDLADPTGAATGAWRAGEGHRMDGAWDAVLSGEQAVGGLAGAGAGAASAALIALALKRAPRPSANMGAGIGGWLGGVWGANAATTSDAFKDKYGLPKEGFDHMDNSSLADLMLRGFEKSACAAHGADAAGMRKESADAGLLDTGIKGVVALSLVTGIPLGIAAHLLGKASTERSMRERELEAKIKYYSTASGELEHRMAGEGL
jgi:hypothetical protein